MGGAILFKEMRMMPKAFALCGILAGVFLILSSK
jgi:hypothetical protein